MAERSAKGCLVAAFIWIVIVGVLAVAGKYFLLPYWRGLKEKEQIVRTGDEERHYDHTVKMFADGFSGYSILRSPDVKKELQGQSVNLAIEDDGARYPERMQALANGEIQMAVFTIDSFVQTGAKLGRYPASIVMVLDETKGADAIVAYKSAVGSLKDLDHPDARFVFVPQSPSEFLARIVCAEFDLSRLPKRWWIEAEKVEDVYAQFRSAGKQAKRAFVLWEPGVSEALELSGAHVLIDSSRVQGYIVDVLVAERNFLDGSRDVVRKVLEAYLRANYKYSGDADALRELVKEDAGGFGQRLKKEQAEKLIRGIAWKNTQENYAHFGLLSAEESRGLSHVGDMIEKIAAILVKTEALGSNPLEGKAHTIYHSDVLRQMQNDKFHPGHKLGIIGSDTLSPEKVRAAAPLPELNEEQWAKLRAVADVKIDPISFRRSAADLNIQSQRNLDDLAKRLPGWPFYYLRVVGHARSEGNREANERLAQDRAGAVVEYLVSKGIEKKRLEAKTAPPSEKGGAAQSVSFVLLERPY